MNISRNISQLEKILDQSASIVAKDSDDKHFKVWKNAVESTLSEIFGDDSSELNQFKKLYFHCHVTEKGVDFTNIHAKYYSKDLNFATTSIKSYVDQLKKERSNVSKIFISHSSNDLTFVSALVDLLELIGISSNSIFCTSLDGYGIDMGEDFLSRIKSELSDDTLVLFLLTDNFYNSPVCLCEMGAAWVLTKTHIPILVPPFNFSKVKGVFPLTQGFKINEPLKINIFKEKIESAFNLPDNTLPFTIWERKRDQIITRINEEIGVICSD